MRAIRFDAARRADTVDIPEPVLQPGQAIVRISSAGICGSDLSALNGTHPFRIPPLISGHEGGGVVTAIDDEGSTLRVGDHVVIEPQRSCGVCEACEADLPHLCQQKLMLGMSEWPGTFAELVTVPSDKLYRVSPAVPTEYLALAEPLAVAIHAVRRVGTNLPNRVAVLGGGAIGSLIVLTLAYEGVEFIAATDVRESNRELCLTMGAQAAADPLVNGWKESLRSSAGGSFDVVFVAAAVPGIVDDANDLVRQRGTIVQVGLFGAPVTFDLSSFQRDEKHLLGSNVYEPADFEAAVRMLEADPEGVARIVNRRATLEQATEYLNARMDGHVDNTIKMLLFPNHS